MSTGQEPRTRRALVLGGSGTVGREVVRGLCAEGVSTVFTWYTAEEVATALGEETGAAPLQLDLADAAAVRIALAGVREQLAPDILVGCAGVAPLAPLGELTHEDWERALRVNAGSVRAALAELAPVMATRGGGDVVVVGGLDRAQSLPVPPAWAATQGLLSALVMAAAKELAPGNVRVNMVALGPLTAGLSARLDPRLREDYLRFSALRRLGEPHEAAAAIVWLALHNTYMAGKVLPVNGGI